MRHSRALVWLLGAVVSATSSSKRGLVFVPNSNWPQDNKVWKKAGSDLTWYYNYGSTPSPAYAQYSQDEFEFVPMLWGNVAGTDWLDEVNAVIKGGRNISHVLGFNEPDGDSSTGGSGLDPSVAAQVWVKNIEPLAAQGVKLGMPACTGGWGGLPWLRQFMGNCSNLVSTGNVTKNCTFDFLPIHWYGNFDGLSSHMGEYAAAFPNMTQWITEYAFDNQDLSTTQTFFNTSADYFDRLDSVGRYSYFGSFRSKTSNVGPNVAMLNNGGDLTDIGSWYLGGSSTGVSPSSGSSSAGFTSYSPAPLLATIVAMGCVIFIGNGY